ncbi:MAG: glycosyltransferase, partial [Asticcacaulis sp.]|nr:glycosyltransferase [Asticcacaulis sp.]
LFDVASFGKGYGEENDFSMRAAARGWRQVAACDVFVRHKGSVSFEDKGEKVAAAQVKLAEFYPDYRGQVRHFLATDPMAAVRNRFQMAQWRDKPVALFISLATGGGVDTNINFLADRLTGEGYRVLIAKRAEGDHYAYAIVEWSADAEKPAALLYPKPGGLAALCAGIIALAPRFIHVHHLIDLEDGDIVRWRDKWHDLLKNAVALIAPSQAAADIYARTFTGLPIEVRPHQGPDVPTVRHETVPLPAKIKVALLGGIGAHKGYKEIIALLRWAEKREPDLSFALIGFSDDIEVIKSFPNLDDMGPYTQANLGEMVRTSGAQVALFLSPWPETYVYTLSEALTHGLTPVANDLGAPGERLRKLGVGELVAPGASHAELVKAIRAAATTRITRGTYSEGRYGSLIGNYYQLDRVADDRRNACVLLPGTEGLHDDAWATRDVTLRFAAANPVNRLKIDFYIPRNFGAQQAEIRINGESYGRVDMPDDDSARRIDIATTPLSGLITVELSFSFLHRLAPPDERMGAAKLGAVSFEYSEESVLKAPSPVAVRLRPSPDLRLEDAELADETGTLEDLYRDVTAYALYRETPGLLTQAKRLVKDALWSARVARRKGPKNALKSFSAMRALRRSSFDETFYRAQLKGSAHEGMDPVNHYVVFGAQEGYDPAPGFSSSFYLTAHDDLARAGVNPFHHYLRHGARENRRVEPSEKIGLFLKAHGGKTHHGALSHTLLIGHGGGSGPNSGKGDWPKRERPGDAAGFTAHDVRPDDDVLDVAYMGKTFLEAHDLLGGKPRWAEAVKEINRLTRPSVSDNPDISVVVPVYGQLAYTLNCLHSLLRQDSRRKFEVLVGDDASPDASEQWLKQVDGIRYIRHATNQGFIANCNATAGQARGRHLVFLNNDTRVADRWLDRLVDSFESFPKAGMVGSKLFYPDGSLQEAGGIVWRDGSAWNYGRNDDPNRPAYSYARAVDYVSGASFMIPRDLWQKLDGFDTRYSPAYYEDTDLAFRVREAGLSVIMQPLSKVVHYEGKTSGTDTESGANAYQAVNKDKFFERWRDNLASHRENGDQPSLERDRQVTKRVLVMDACNPTPSKDAGSKATVDLIRY